MSFLGSVFGGQNKTLDSQIPMLTSMAGNLTKSGTSGLNDATSFFHKVLNGDFSSYAPQIGAMRKQGQQSLLQMSEFGNRSGGNNAAAQTTGDRVTAGINDLMAGAKQGAAAQIGQLGSATLDAGLQASNMAVTDSQQQMENWMKSVLGQGISEGAGYLESKGLKKV